MKVSELIDKLKQFSDNTVVETEFGDIADVVNDSMNRSHSTAIITLTKEEDSEWK